MPLPLEASTWDEGRIQEEILLLLPPDWLFELRPNEDATGWEAVFSDTEGVEIWKEEHFVAQMVLLNALGWLVSKGAKPQESGAWVRRSGELSKRPHDRLFSLGLTEGDPPDLDPEGVASVYSGHSRKS